MNYKILHGKGNAIQTIKQFFAFFWVHNQCTLNQLLIYKYIINDFFNKNVAFIRFIIIALQPTF